MNQGEGRGLGSTNRVRNIPKREEEAEVYDTVCAFWVCLHRKE
jgi:hypothetical protein